MTILMGFMPSILAWKGLAAREIVAGAFDKYFRARGHEKASMFSRDRCEVSQRNGVPLADVARCEIMALVAVLINTTPATFWMLLFIYSRPVLLHEIREEVDAITQISEVKAGPVRHLDVTKIKHRCPVLISTFQEVLRLQSVGVAVREVMADTMLNDEWLLKKECMIQMPTRIIHRDPGLWGLDVDEFRPRRFMAGGAQQTRSGKRPSDMCFRPFGGGKSLCPGRHFATTEVLAVVGMFVARYEMKPSTGEWEMPEVGKTNVSAILAEPDNDVEVDLSFRRGFECAKWVVDLDDSDRVVAVVAEDRQTAPGE